MTIATGHSGWGRESILLRGWKGNYLKIKYIYIFKERMEIYCWGYSSSAHVAIFFFSSKEGGNAIQLWMSCNCQVSIRLRKDIFLLWEYPILLSREECPCPFSSPLIWPNILPQKIWAVGGWICLPNVLKKTYRRPSFPASSNSVILSNDLILRICTVRPNKFQTVSCDRILFITFRPLIFFPANQFLLWRSDLVSIRQLPK